jgi:hypothetical protein
MNDLLHPILNQNETINASTIFRVFEEVVELDVAVKAKCLVNHNKCTPPLALSLRPTTNFHESRLAVFQVAVLSVRSNNGFP